jgi:hypothetical protein
MHFPQHKIVVPKHSPISAEVYNRPVDLTHPVTIRWETKKLLMTAEFQDSLPDELKNRVKDIFSGCGCHTSQKIDAILPEIQSQVDVFFAKMK